MKCSRVSQRSDAFTIRAFSFVSFFYSFLNAVSCKISIFSSSAQFKLKVNKENLREAMSALDFLSISQDDYTNCMHSIMGINPFWKSNLIFCAFKGQLILKWLFGVFNFLQKTNKNKSHCSKIEFVWSGLEETLF